MKPKPFSEQKTSKRRDVAAEVTINVAAQLTINETVLYNESGLRRIPNYDANIFFLTHLTFSCLFFRIC